MVEKERGSSRAVAALVIVAAVAVGVGIYVHNFAGGVSSESGEGVEVLWISSIAMDEQSQGKMVVKFKNTGETPTDFSISVDPPKSVFVKNNPSPVSLDPGELWSRAQGWLGILPYSSIGFLIGLALGLWKG